MELIILRHGEAGSAALDQERPLTDYGRQQIAGQYQWLQEHQFEPELILHSPYRRTTETADLASVLFPNAELQVEPLLTPDGD
ncbi:MAG: histidine phosphatase, partial [Gammaproteobacteria bacterium]